MADITKAADAHIDASTAMFAGQLTGSLIAGEALGAVNPCYISTADGKVYNSIGTAANNAAQCDGFTPVAYAAGEAVTLFGVGTRFRYASSGLTPGANYYVSVTAGGGKLGDAPSTGGTRPVARAINATDIYVISLV